MSELAIKTVDPTDTLAVLKAAEEWLSDPAHWTTGTCWRTAEDRELTNDREAVAKTCLIGACSLVAGAQYNAGWPDATYSHLFEALGGISLGQVNDGPNGYNRVMAGLRKAIETLEAQS